MSKKAFGVGEYVVYPSHGVGVVQGIENQDVGETKIEVLSILFEKDKMVIKIPLNSAITRKIRPLCSEEEMAAAVEALKVPARIKKMMWSRRAQDYEMKINSGDIVSISQVVRDLHKTATQPEHSYSERQIYQEALDRLMREYAAVKKIDENQAMEQLQKILAA